MLGFKRQYSIHLSAYGNGLVIDLQIMHVNMMLLDEISIKLLSGLIWFLISLLPIVDELLMKLSLFTD